MFILMELMSQGVWGCGLGYGCEGVMCAYVCVYVSVSCTWMVYTHIPQIRT